MQFYKAYLVLKFNYPFFSTTNSFTVTLLQLHFSYKVCADKFWVNYISKIDNRPSKSFKQIYFQNVMGNVCKALVHFHHNVLICDYLRFQLDVFELQITN